ncbi:MAG TPA: arsenite methyltransferase [bacterium]|nr:arsenite methyltransferase [bacterium]
MPKSEEEIRKSVREGYAKVARTSGSCCGSTKGCCGTSAPEAVSRAVGYSDAELAALPEGANLGLGCGNPVALASLRPGETVLDLGSGAGIDCFLAARKVGPTGQVIGVDMTPEMLEKARQNAAKVQAANVEFRLGEIEHLPVSDNSVDAVVSNCVINLSPDKPQVFRDTYRVLRPGGRLMVSDLALTAELPSPVRDSVAAYVGCVAGALLKTDYLAAITGAGFTDVRVVSEEHYPVDLLTDDPQAGQLMVDSGLSREELLAAAQSVVSIKVFARKPA